MQNGEQTINKSSRAEQKHSYIARFVTHAQDLGHCGGLQL